MPSTRHMMIVAGSVITVAAFSSFALSEAETEASVTDVSWTEAEFKPLDGLGEMFRDIRKAVANKPKVVVTPASSGVSAGGECKSGLSGLQPRTFSQPVALTDSDAAAAAAAPEGAY